MALHSSDGSTLLADGVQAYTTSDDATYIEITFSAPAAVVATNYLLAWCDSGGNVFPRYTDATGTYKTNAWGVYASFPYTPIGTETHTFSRNYAVSLYVE